MSRRAIRAFVAFVLFMSVGMSPAAANPGAGVLLDRQGLMWTAEPHFVVGWAEAREIIAAMNAGAIENYGYRDWRLASVTELNRWAESGAYAGDLRRLHAYLAAYGRKPSTTESPNALATKATAVFAWPVRSGAGSGGPAIVVTNSVWLKKNSTIAGDVIANGVNDPTVLPTLIPGVEAQVDQNTAISGKLAADTVGNEPGVTTGQTNCNTIQGTGPLTCQNLPSALLFPILGLPAFNAVQSNPAAAADVVVAANQTANLAAGTYRDIILNKNSKVCFSGGLVEARRILGGESGQKLAFQKPTEVRLTGRLVLGSSPFVGADNGTFGCAGASSNPSAAQIVLYVAGTTVVTGAGKSNDRGKLRANFYLGSGAMETGKDTDIDGLIIARDYTMNQDTTMTRNTNLPFGQIPTGPTADPQDVFTNGDVNLDIILTGSDPKGQSLTFSITGGPTAGAIVAGPTPIQDPAQTFCSGPEPRVQCTVDGDCPLTETCSVSVLPPISRASVTYDPPGSLNVTDAFTFKVTNTSAQMSSAVVDINPPGDATGGATPIATVEAIDASTETTVATTLKIRLRGDAPCDTFDASGACTAGVGLTFAVGAGCSGGCSGPSFGTLANLTPESAAVVRTATVDYSPTGPAGTVDSFQFQVCGTIGAGPVCDIGVITVATEAPQTLAENQTVSIQLNQSIDITLAVNPGGAGGPATKGTVGAGRLVYIGTDPSSDQHGGSADFGTGFCSITTTQSCSSDSSCPVGERCTAPWSGLPNSASRLSANAARWAGNSEDPAIACVDGDPIFFGSHVEDLLNSQGLSCDVIAASALATAPLIGNFDVLYTGATRDNVPALVAAAGNVANFVNSGGGLVVETNIVNAGSWTWVPLASQIGHSGPANLGGMSAQIVEPLHPVMVGLSDLTLSNWGISVHTTFDTPERAGFTTVAVGENAEGTGNFKPYIIVSADTPVLQITSLPSFGTLKVGSTPITSVPFTLSSFVVTYTNTAPAPSDSFSYKVTSGALNSIGIITTILNDTCAEQGRPPGCAPGG